MEKKFQIELTGEEAVAVVKWIIERREQIERRALEARMLLREAYFEQKAREEIFRASLNAS